MKTGIQNPRPSRAGSRQEGCYAALDAAICAAAAQGKGQGIPKRLLTEDTAVVREAERLAALVGRQAWRLVQRRIEFLRSRQRLRYSRDAGWSAAPPQLLPDQCAGDLVLLVREGRAVATRVSSSSSITITTHRGRYYRQDGMPAGLGGGRCEPFSPQRLAEINAPMAPQGVDLPAAVRNELGKLEALASLRDEARAVEAIRMAVAQLESAAPKKSIQ